MKEKTKKQRSLQFEYDPNFATFPLANTVGVEEDSKVTFPSEDDVNEVKNWVDFKEM